MPNWTGEVAQFNALKAGKSYSKRQAAETLHVSVPKGTRDWGGIVRFSNGTAIFVTLEKSPDRYAKEHRYSDQFDGGLLYWDSRASHDHSSSQVQFLRDPRRPVVAFARVSEKFSGQTAPFCFVGRLGFVDWWGKRPVHFTWKLEDFPNGLDVEPDELALTELAEWKPQVSRSSPSTTVRQAPPNRSRIPRVNTLPFREGTKTLVTMNRYERDPRARRECLAARGTACVVCGFDFASVYGFLGEGFIVVHHRIPVSVRARAGEYQFDPIRDLVPLCGNCHAIVHRRAAKDTILREGSLSNEARRRLLELRADAAPDSWETIE